MKRIDLVRHVEGQGCVTYREGSKHTVFLNPEKWSSFCYPATSRNRYIPRQKNMSPVGYRLAKELDLRVCWGQSVTLHPTQAQARRLCYQVSTIAAGNVGARYIVPLLER